MKRVLGVATLFTLVGCSPNPLTGASEPTWLGQTVLAVVVGAALLAGLLVLAYYSISWGDD